MNITLSQKFKF